jgi:pilus assembly protein CpaC
MSQADNRPRSCKSEAPAITDHSLYVVGKNFGTTSISIFNENMQLVELLDVEVMLDTFNLEEKIRRITGIDTIQVSSINGKVVLSGTVPDAVSADHAVSLAKALSNEIINLMTIVPIGQRFGKP